VNIAIGVLIQDMGLSFPAFAQLLPTLVIRANLTDEATWNARFTIFA
jgi:hypothetical protein